MTDDYAVRYPAEAADAECLAPADAALLLAAAPWRRMVVLGDSVAAGVRDPLEGYADRSMTERVADALAAAHPDLVQVNLAMPYLRIGEIRETQLAAALDLRPDLVLVSAGGNDAFSSRFDAGRARRELDGLLRPLAQSGALVVTWGLYDLPRSGLVAEEVAIPLAMRFDELDAVVQHVTRTLGGVHADTHHHPRGTDPAIYSADGVHANARGHAVAFTALATALAGALAAQPTRRAGSR